MSSPLQAEKDFIPLPGRSERQPPVADEDKTTVFETTTYQRDCFDMDVLVFRERFMSSFRQGLATTFPTPPVANLGALDKLPPELVWLLLEDHVDIASLVQFRQVNRRARQFVDAMPAFQAIAKYATDAVAGFCILGRGLDFSATQLRELLRTDQCQTCLDFGPFLFLPTLSRCCGSCLKKGDATLLAGCAVEFDDGGEDTEEDHQDGGHWESDTEGDEDSDEVSSRYSDESGQNNFSGHGGSDGPGAKLDPYAVYEVDSLSPAPSDAPMCFKYRTLRSVIIPPFALYKPLDCVFRLTHIRPVPPSERAVQAHLGLDFRFLVTTMLPYVHRVAEAGKVAEPCVESGMSCGGCRRTCEDHYDECCELAEEHGKWPSDRMFTAERFLEHFRWCEHAQAKWRSAAEEQQAERERGKEGDQSGTAGGTKEREER